MYRFMLYRRDPFVIWTLAFFIIASIGNLITGAEPGTAAALVPTWYLDTWLVITLISALVYGYGIFTRNLLNGLFITWSLCPILATSVTALGAAQIVVAGAKATISGGLIIGLGIAFLQQRRLLSKIVRDLPKKERVKK